MTYVDRVKIFGERNTGTNLLERALSESTCLFIYPGNLPRGTLRLHAYLGRFVPAQDTVDRIVEAHRDWLFTRRFDYSLGWKHARTPPEPPPGESLPDGLGFVTLRKNPYSWLLSLHRRPYAVPRPRRYASASFSEFLRMPWPTARRENARAAYESPADIWSDKVGSYSALDAMRPTHHMRYEDFLEDPHQALNGVAQALNIEVRAENADFERATKGDDGSRERYRDYYLGEAWRAKLTPKDVAFINTRLDADLVRRAGYELIDPDAL